MRPAIVPEVTGNHVGATLGLARSLANDRCDVVDTTALFFRSGARSSRATVSIGVSRGLDHSHNLCQGARSRRSENAADSCARTGGSRAAGAPHARTRAADRRRCEAGAGSIALRA